jgi:hypothetical protein
MDLDDYVLNEEEKMLATWLEPNHPDILIDLLKRKPDYPNNWDLVDIMDDNYSDVYHYYCEYT